MFLYEQGANLTSDAKLVYIVLISFMNDATGLCCPSYDSLMARSSLSRVRVSKALNELAYFGWIVKQRKFNSVTRYFITRPFCQAINEYPVKPSAEAARQYKAMVKTERAAKRKRKAFKVVA